MSKTTHTPLKVAFKNFAEQFAPAHCAEGAELEWDDWCEQVDNIETLIDSYLPATANDRWELLYLKAASERDAMKNTHAALVAALENAISAATPSVREFLRPGDDCTEQVREETWPEWVDTARAVLAKATKQVAA